MCAGNGGRWKLFEELGKLFGADPDAAHGRLRCRRCVDAQVRAVKRG